MGILKGFWIRSKSLKKAASFEDGTLADVSKVIFQLLARQINPFRHQITSEMLLNRFIPAAFGPKKEDSKYDYRTGKVYSFRHTHSGSLTQWEGGHWVCSFTRSRFGFAPPHPAMHFRDRYAHIFSCHQPPFGLSGSKMLKLFAAIIPAVRFVCCTQHHHHRTVVVVRCLSFVFGFVSGSGNRSGCGRPPPAVKEWRGEHLQRSLWLLAATAALTGRRFSPQLRGGHGGFRGRLNGGNRLEFLIRFWNCQIRWEIVEILLVTEYWNFHKLPSKYHQKKTL